MTACIGSRLDLDDEEMTLLARAAARIGASRSELIRRAIRIQYGEQTTQTRLAALHASAGTWRDRYFTGADYVDKVRGNLDEPS